MPTEIDDLTQIQKLLAAGEIQAAADFAATAKADAIAAAGAAAGTPPTPPPPRPPDVIIVDFMEAVAGRFGHHPELEALVIEMRETLTPPPPAPPSPAPAPAPTPAAA